MAGEKNCPRGRWISIKRKTTSGGLEFVKFYSRCKTWKCPHCAPIQKDLLSEKIRKFFAGKSIFHYSFTVRNTGQGSERTVKHIKQSFSRFRKKINRRYGRFPYVYFLEFTAKGAAHYHLLTTLEIPKWRAKDLWYQSTRNSYQVGKSKHAEKHGIVMRYVVKYVLKQVKHWNGSSIYGHRMYCYSSHFFNPPKPPTSWELVGMWKSSLLADIEHYSAVKDAQVQLSDLVRGSPRLSLLAGFEHCFLVFDLSLRSPVGRTAGASI
jgi:hypothetical protein